MNISRPARRWRGPPLALQILALLIGGLVVAQVVTLALSLLLPPSPAPQYELADIASVLAGDVADAQYARPLLRTVQRQAPDPDRPGWLTSDRSRQDLARLLDLDESEVRLYFYTPLPFAGTTTPTPLPRTRSDTDKRLTPRNAGWDVDGNPGLMRVGLLVAQAGGGGGGGAGGGSSGGGGGDGGSGRAGGGNSDGGGKGDGGERGGSQGGSSPDTGADAAAPGVGEQRDPSPSAPPSPDRSAPVQSAEPSQDAAPDPRTVDRGNGSADPRGAASGPSRDVLPAPALQAAPPARADPPVTVTAPAPTTAPARQPPATTAPEPSPTPQPALPDANRTLPSTPSPPSPPTARPPAAAADASAPRSLFALSPFVEGDFIAAARMESGDWAVVQPTPEPFPNSWQRRLLLWFAIAVSLVAPLGWLFSRRIVRPIAAFAAAAEQLGRDPAAPVLPVDGPAEIGRAALAFNRMQGRLRSFVEDRTTMIGAISHDLRTPLTRMRFRVEDAPADIREGMLSDVEEMERMIHSVLAFSRDASEPGSREVLDLKSLVEDVVEDAVFVGKDVVLDNSESAPVEVDAIGMRRLLANLIENAVKYGSRARLRLFTDRHDAVVELADDGPGLPDDELEQVFQPFYRTPAARASGNAGSGMGLAVCRSIARAHGGDVSLRRGTKGLIAQVRVPLAFAARTQQR